MSIIQTFLRYIQEQGAYHNGRPTTLWVPHVTHRGPFGEAVSRGQENDFRPLEHHWKFTSIDGSTLYVGHEAEAVQMCAFGLDLSDD